jgi:hypothetical protein
MCQANDELATQLVDTMHASRLRVDIEVWRALEDYVYAKADGED